MGMLLLVVLLVAGWAPARALSRRVARTHVLTTTAVSGALVRVDALAPEHDELRIVVRGPYGTAVGELVVAQPLQALDAAPTLARWQGERRALRLMTWGHRQVLLDPQDGTVVELAGSLAQVLTTR